MRYLLDTTFVIDHMRGVEAALRRFEKLVEDGDEPFVNDIVTCETWAGAREPSDPDLEALLRFIEFVQPGPGTAQTAGRWRADARARARTLSLADALIAATAEALGAAILTRNIRDFALTPARIETY